MGSIQASTAIPMKQLTVAAGSITASYTAVGTFSGPAIALYITSTMDQAVQLSLDGVNDFIPVPIGNTVPAFLTLDIKSNLMVLSTPTIYVKRIGTPTVGSLFISGFTAITP